MSGEAVEIDDVGPFIPALAAEANRGPALQQLSTETAGGLIADQHDGIARVVEVILEMIDDAARFAHAARRDQDASLAACADVLGLAPIAHKMHDRQFPSVSSPVLTNRFERI